jgi:hypothetical protein
MTTSELLPYVFVPALIGCDRHVLRIGRRLFFRHGMLSHVFAERFPLFCRLSPWMICHTLPIGASSALYQLALSDFAAEQKELDRTPLLFYHSNAQAALFTSEQKESLEASFVLCPNADEPTLSRLIASLGGDSP